MDGSSPRSMAVRRQQFALPLPNGPVLFTPSAVVDLVYEGSEDWAEELSGDTLVNYLTGFANGKPIEELLTLLEAPRLNERRRPSFSRANLQIHTGFKKWASASSQSFPFDWKGCAGLGRMGWTLVTPIPVCIHDDCSNKRLVGTNTFGHGNHLATPVDSRLA